MKTIRQLVNRIEKAYQHDIENDSHPTDEELEFYGRCNPDSWATVMMVAQTENYQCILSKLRKKDVLMDMGAGDLRLALKATEKCQKVYAVELCPYTVYRSLQIIGYSMPPNLIVTCAD